MEPRLTPYERKLVKTHQWDGVEHRAPGVRNFSPFAKRYRDRMFFYQMLSLVLFITTLVLAWVVYLGQ